MPNVSISLNFTLRSSFIARLERITPIESLRPTVKSAFGYHIILIEARQTKTLADARAEIEGKMKPDMAQQGLDALKKKTAITLNDTYFGK